MPAFKVRHWSLIIDSASQLPFNVEFKGSFEKVWVGGAYNSNLFGGRSVKFAVKSLKSVASRYIDAADLLDLGSGPQSGSISRSDLHAADSRRQGVYVNADATERDLDTRWAQYDDDYRAVPRYNEKWIAEIEGGVIYPPYGIISVGNTIVRETIRDSNIFAATFPGLDRTLARKAMKNENFSLDINNNVDVGKILDSGFSLGWGLPYNYFNWTLRYLSKVAVWQRDFSSIPMIVPALSMGFMRKTLEFYGVHEKMVCSIDVPTKVKNLTISSPMALGRYELSPSLCHAVGEYPRVKSVWAGGEEALYIPRGDVKMRSVLNERDVCQALAQNGFHTFDAGAHPIVEQIRAFRTAKYIVAPHGAALTNLMYCRPGNTVIVEIVPEGYDQGVTSYRSLSDLFDLDYVQMFGKEVEFDRKGNRCNSNITISIEHLLKIIDGVMI